MFGLLARSSGRRQPLARRTTTLRLEQLEDRVCPFAIAGETLTLSVTYLQGQQATFSGQLYNQNGPIANQAINLNGVVTTTTSTDSQGNYSTTVPIPQSGTENAVSANGLSNIAAVAVEPNFIAINSFSATYLGNNIWLLSGSVSGNPLQGAVVNFGGINALQGQSTGVNADGTFDFYVTVPAGGGGVATAQAVDTLGDTSETESTTVQS